MRQRGKEMEKIITYVAYDGARFDNEHDCRDYEMAMNVERFEDDFSIYNCLKKPISHRVGWQDENVCYIIIKNPSVDLMEYLEYRFDLYDISIPWRDCGLEFKEDCYFIDHRSVWHSWSEEIEILEDIGDHFQLFTEN